MEINYYKEPFPHYVIDDFLNPRAAKQVLQECIDLEPFYGQAKIVSDDKEASHPKECKECEINFDHFRNTMRDNRIVMLDHIYKKKRKNSYTLEHLHSTIISDQFKKFAEHSEHIFPILNFVNSSESMVSRYGKCDFYGWHHDSSPTHKERIMNPLIRDNIDDPWRIVPWDEAISFAAKRFKEIQKKHGRKSVGGITSSRCTNEEVFIVQKLVRAAGHEAATGQSRVADHAGTGTSARL